MNLNLVFSFGQQAQDFYQRQRDGDLPYSHFPLDEGVMYNFAAEEKILYNLVVPGAGVGG